MLVSVLEWKMYMLNFYSYIHNITVGGLCCLPRVAALVVADILAE